jgi:ABC-type transport system involved in multi-copper enzyme maturation permease subunit
MVIINLIVYCRLKKSPTVGKITALLRQLIIVAVIIAITVLVAMAICIFQFVGTSPFDYVLYELFWCLTICVHLGIFFLLIREQKKQTVVAVTSRTISVPDSITSIQVSAAPQERTADTGTETSDEVNDSESG